MVKMVCGIIKVKRKGEDLVVVPTGDFQRSVSMEGMELGLWEVKR